ncbi:hypothetical protein C8R44DRAFT_618339, partial [Mycena epipterygia]
KVWGYLWTPWYSPKMSKPRAHSASALLSHLRTTINIENFWKQVKHGCLHNHLHPRLDQFVWILIPKVTPAYLAQVQLLNDRNQLGCSKLLIHFQFSSQPG